MKEDYIKKYLDLSINKVLNKYRDAHKDIEDCMSSSYYSKKLMSTLEHQTKRYFKKYTNNEITDEKLLYNMLIDKLVSYPFYDYEYLTDDQKYKILKAHYIEPVYKGLEW